MNEVQIEEGKEEHGMTKISESRCNKRDFEEELSKQNHSNEIEKSILMKLWKKRKDPLKEKVGYHTNSKVKLHFKEGARKRHQLT